MEATDLASWGRVPVVLTKDNYERWKTLMKNYLLGENLWTVVESGSVGPDVNAKALYILQLSCGPKIFDEIKHFQKAKEAWNHLSAQYGSELKATPDIEQGVVDDNLREYKDLYGYVEKGDWRNAESFITDKNNALLSKSALDRTVLHVATMAGHVNIVEGLVRKGGGKLVKMQDAEGYTALALAARLTGNIDVARCMVEKTPGLPREDLLWIKNEDGEIPVLVAAAKGHKEMTRYLYKETPKNILLDREDSRSRVLLLERCIKAEIFDVALELLESDPGQLLTESLSDGFGALHALAQIPSAFLSGCQFGLIQKFIYYILGKEKKFQSSGEGCHKTKFPGIREIYEQKCTHYQVERLLWYSKRRVAGFTDSQLTQASVYDAMLDAARHGIVEFINAMRDAA